MKNRAPSNTIQRRYLFPFFLLILVFVSFGCFSPFGDDFDCWLNSDNCEPILPPMQIDQELTYTGTATISRGEKHCPQTGDVVITMKPDNTFIMKVTATYIDANCQVDGDFVTDVFEGTLDLKNSIMNFPKCSYNDIPPTSSSILWDKKVASGTVTCLDKDFDGKTVEILSVEYNTSR
jgi:hypothetical protein